MENPFSRSAGLVLVLVVGTSLLLGLILALFGESPERSSSGSDGTSSSALGHRAFLELLRREPIPVVVSRVPAPPSPGSLLVLAEPEVGGSDGSGLRLQSYLEDWERVLLVLPKWRGHEDEQHPGWIESVSLREETRVAEVLEELELEGTVLRLPDAAALAWREPYGFLPTLARPQLITSDEIEPVIDCDQGILLGRLPAEDGDSRRWVLSDPDLLANHGLGRGDNAALVRAIVGDLVADGAPVVVDETLHGGIRVQSLLRELTRFPLALVLIQALLTLAVLLWAAVKRFGPILPVPAALGRSKQALLDNTAQLLLLGGHHGPILARYWNQTLHVVADAGHVPPGESAVRLERLQLASTRRGLADHPRELQQDLAALDTARPAASIHFLRLARRIHAWREEMSHGSRAST